ncbi:MAG: hypothetical protein U0992_02850 [Planctomycetaceae bacterium]
MSASVFTLRRPDDAQVQASWKFSRELLSTYFEVVGAIESNIPAGYLTNSTR